MALSHAQDDAESLKQPSDAVRELDLLRHELRAGDEHGLDGMGVHALDANLPIPADAHDLRDAVRVICVSLVDLKRQRRLCMTRVDADDRQLPCPQLVEQPGRELAGFQTDPHRSGRMPRNDSVNAFGGRAALGLPDCRSGIVDDADCGLLERYVEPDILLLRGCAPVRDDGSTDATSAGLRDYRMSRPALRQSAARSRGNRALRRKALLLEQFAHQPHGRAFIPARLDQQIAGGG